MHPQIMKEFKALAWEYVEFKKEKFREAQDLDEKFVEAKKLVDLYFLSVS